MGLSSNYTGTPDLEMGDFEQAYEDSLGNVVTVNTNECVFVGSRGQNGAHAGRATPEYCTVDTALHPDRRYTIALDTWSLPMDDDLLSFGLLLVLEDLHVCNFLCSLAATSVHSNRGEAQATDL